MNVSQIPWVILTVPLKICIYWGYPRFLDNFPDQIGANLFWRYLGLGALAYKPGYRTRWTSPGGAKQHLELCHGGDTFPKYTLEFGGFWG